MVKKLLEKLISPILIFIKLIKKVFKTIPKIFKAAIKTLIYFVTNFVPTLLDIFKSLGIFVQSIFYYLKNPLKLFDLFVQIVLFVPLMLVSIFYHIPLKKNYKLGECWLYFITFKFYSLYFLVLVVSYFLIFKLVFEYLILHNIDKKIDGFLSSFYYRYILAIENSPENWFNSPSYHLNNRNTRYLFAFNQCPKGYQPNGVFCEKLEKYIPDYCEVAHIYDQYTNEEESKKNKGLYYAKNLNQNETEFIKKNSEEKKRIIDDYKFNVKQHNDKCASMHQNKETLIKSICKSSDDPLISGLCKKQYCSNTNEPFCFNHSKIIENDQKNNSNTMIILYIFIIILLGTVTTLKFSSLK